MQEKLKINQKCWDIVADHFDIETAGLPHWAPFEVREEDLELLQNIEGKTFLELACGSGRSVEYLIKNGAKKVYGADISEEQVRKARKRNEDAIAEKKVELFCTPMEEQLQIEKVECIFSIFGIGWTLDMATTFSHIRSYLATGGQFVWSWEHPVYSNFEHGETREDVRLTQSYFDSGPRVVAEFMGEKGAECHIPYHTVSEWFAGLAEAGFEVKQLLEPQPKELPEGKPLGLRKNLPRTIIFDCQVV